MTPTIAGAKISLLWTFSGRIIFLAILITWIKWPYLCKSLHTKGRWCIFTQQTYSLIFLPKIFILHVWNGKERLIKAVTQFSFKAILQRNYELQLVLIYNSTPLCLTCTVLFFRNYHSVRDLFACCSSSGSIFLRKVLLVPPKGTSDSFFS